MAADAVVAEKANTARVPARAIPNFLICRILFSACSKQKPDPLGGRGRASNHVALGARGEGYAPFEQHWRAIKVAQKLGTLTHTKKPRRVTGAEFSYTGRLNAGTIRTLQPRSRALSLAARQALARNSAAVIGMSGSSLGSNVFSSNRKSLLACNT